MSVLVKLAERKAQSHDPSGLNLRIVFARPIFPVNRFVREPKTAAVNL
jgi:hypothetical protein